MQLLSTQQCDEHLKPQKHTRELQVLTSEPEGQEIPSLKADQRPFTKGTVGALHPCQLLSPAPEALPAVSQVQLQKHCEAHQMNLASLLPSNSKETARNKMEFTIFTTCQGKDTGYKPATAFNRGITCLI